MSAEAYRETLVEPRDRLALAFDMRGLDPALPIMDILNPYAAIAKFNAAKLRPGLDAVREAAHERGMELWDDGKYKDTPRTVRDSVAESTAAGSRLITVHLSNTYEALENALQARNAERERMKAELGDDYDPLVGTLLGITVLTSYKPREHKEDFGTDDIEMSVLRLAKKAAAVGFDGVVSSANELEVLNRHPRTRRLLKVTPGLALTGGEAGSGQARVNTFAGAMALRADIVVGGSAITKAEDMAAAAQMVLDEIAEGLAA